MEEAYQNRGTRSTAARGRIIAGISDVITESGGSRRRQRNFLRCFLLVKILVENYQMQDLLGIADILYGGILPALDGESR